MIDKDYIDSLLIDDKGKTRPAKEAKSDLAEYAQGFGIKLNKRQNYEKMIEDLQHELSLLANIPMPDEPEGSMNTADIIDIAESIDGITDPLDAEVLEQEVTEPESQPIEDLEQPAPGVEEHIEEIKVVEEPQDLEPKVELLIDSPVVEEIKAVVIKDQYSLPKNFNPKFNPINGVFNIPYWLHDWIVANPDWKSKIDEYPKKHELPMLQSLVYYIDRLGEIKIRESRNSRFFVIS